jgi:N-acetylglucosamine-6-phosphate deacetylase
MLVITLMQSQYSLVIDQVKVLTAMEFINKGYASARNGIVVEVARGQLAGPYEQVIPMISRPQHTLGPGMIDAHIHALGGNIEREY